MKLKIEKRTSKKTGNPYICIVAYNEDNPNGVILSFNKATAMRLGNLTHKDLESLNELTIE